MPGILRWRARWRLLDRNTPYLHKCASVFIAVQAVFQNSPHGLIFMKPDPGPYELLGAAHRLGHTAVAITEIIADRG